MNLCPIKIDNNVFEIIFQEFFKKIDAIIIINTIIRSLNFLNPQEVDNQRFSVKN